ncbi:unnamed protein product, partial [Polarella glacialis]
MSCRRASLDRPRDTEGEHNRVQVFARARPPVAHEAGSAPVVDVNEVSRVVRVEHPSSSAVRLLAPAPVAEVCGDELGASLSEGAYSSGDDVGRAFAFDGVFGADSTQQ